MFKFHYKEKQVLTQQNHFMTSVSRLEVYCGHFDL